MCLKISHKCVAFLYFYELLPNFNKKINILFRTFSNLSSNLQGVNFLTFPFHPAETDKIKIRQIYGVDFIDLTSPL